MRPARDENERIDMIDIDPAVFVDDGATHGANRSRQVLKAVGFMAVISVAAATWWPRSEPSEWRVFQAAPVPAAGLTEELVFDEPPGLLLTADLAPSAADIKPELGYVFAEPGGTYLTRRWASFRTHPTNSNAAPVSTDGPLVGGVPADVRRVRVRHFIEWGPLDGRMWTVSTNRFDEDEAIDFANHVAIIEERPALAHRYDLGAMQPVGSIAALDCVVMLTSLLRGDRLLGPVMPTVLTWATAASPENHTLAGAVSLSSIPAPSDALPLVEFVLGAGSATTVHGQPAVLIAPKSLGPVVAWLEDGRLIMVLGELADDELIALAESVRPATTGEWRVVGRVAVRDDDGFSFNLGDSVTLYQGIEPLAGGTFAFTVQVVEDQLLVCLEGWPAGVVCDASLGLVELPLLTIVELNEYRFVLAIVDRAEAQGAALIIKPADGSFGVMLPLEDISELPGAVVATLLPTDYRAIELWNAGEVVAAI